MVLLVALDGLAHDALDRVQEDLLRSLLSSDPKLKIVLRCKFQKRQLAVSTARKAFSSVSKYHRT